MILWKTQPNLWKTQVWPNGPKICARRTKTDFKDWAPTAPALINLSPLQRFLTRFPYMVLHDLCSTHTSGGHFRPFKVNQCAPTAPFDWCLQRERPFKSNLMKTFWNRFFCILLYCGHPPLSAIQLNSFIKHHKEPCRYATALADASLDATKPRQVLILILMMMIKMMMTMMINCSWWSQ